MTTQTFFDLFMEELKNLPELSHYYKFHTSEKGFEFRKNYFMQRLDYVFEALKQHEKHLGRKPVIWDLGCGYGTTCLFLAMNGYETYGSTLEFYYKFLPLRREFWSNHGNTELFRADYQDLFEDAPSEASIDVIIVQDTLHHLEPIHEAMQIIRKSIRQGGIMIGIEENGNNIIQNLKLYKQRGNNRIITFWDEKLQKNITMGNENIRGLNTWRNILLDAQFKIQANSENYIRLLPPFAYGNTDSKKIAQLENKLGNPILQKYFYFGINFIAEAI